MLIKIKAYVPQKFDDRAHANAEESYIKQFIGRIGEVVKRYKNDEHPYLIRFFDGAACRFHADEVEHPK